MKNHPAKGHKPQNHHSTNRLCCKKTARGNFDFLGLFKAPQGIDLLSELWRKSLLQFFFLGGIH